MFYGVTLVWGQPSYMVRAVHWPALAWRSSTGAPSCTSPATWFGPFNGLLLPEGTPQVHPVGAPGRHMRRCQSALFLWTREQSTWPLTLVQGPARSHGLTEYPRKSLWRVSRVFYWVTLVWDKPSYMVRAVQRPALARRNSTGAPSCTSPATWFGPFNGLPVPGGTPQVHPVAPAQLHGSGRSTACPATWFGPFNGLLLPGETPQVLPRGAPRQVTHPSRGRSGSWKRRGGPGTLWPLVLY